MQATRLHDEPSVSSGTFEAGTHSAVDRVEEAHRLALEVERLLTPVTGDSVETYDARITRALARSLIDALSDMQRSAARRAKSA